MLIAQVLKTGILWRSLDIFIHIFKNFRNGIQYINFILTPIYK